MPEGLLSAGSPRIASLPQWGRLIGGGFAEIDEEVAAVLAFVISHTTFLAAQDDEMRRGVEIMAMPEGLLTAASRFGFLSSTAGSPMKKSSCFARNDDAGAGVSRRISLPVPSP